MILSSKSIDCLIDSNQRFAVKTKSLAYEPKAGEAVMTVHRWFEKPWISAVFKDLKIEQIYDLYQNNYRLDGTLPYEGESAVLLVKRKIFIDVEANPKYLIQFSIDMMM